MVWTLFLQQQQRGAQFPVSPKKSRQPGESQQPQQQQGETELEQDERGEDAEQTIDAQAEDDPSRFDRND